MAKRLKGSNTTIGVMSTAGTEKTFDDVKSFEFTVNIETLKVDLLGKPTPDFDEVDEGVEGNFELYVSKADALDFIDKVRQRIHSPVQTIQFNANCTANFPDGQNKRCYFNDIYFGALPVTVGGRGEFVMLKVPWKCSSPKFK